MIKTGRLTWHLTDVEEAPDPQTGVTIIMAARLLSVGIGE